MAGAKQRKPMQEFTGEMNINVSKFLPIENEVVILSNADTEVLGKLKKRKGTTKVGNSLTSTSTTTTSTSTTTISTSTSST